MKSIRAAFVAATLLTSASVMAETITLHDGRVINGTIQDKVDNTLIINTFGVELKLDINDVKSIDMTSGTSTTKPVPVAKPVSVTSQAPAAKAPVQKVKSKPEPVKLTLPTGKEIHAKMFTSISTADNKQGERFTAALEGDLRHNGILVAKRGSKIYGTISHLKKSGRLVGKPSLSIELTHIMINNEMYSIVTSQVSSEASRTLGKSLKQTAGAAAIGGLIDGSDGAQTGAAVGAGVALLSRGNSIEINQGTLLQFNLKTPLNVTAYK